MRRSAELQAALHAAVAPAVAPVPVFDAPPEGTEPDLWVHLGEGQVDDAPDTGGSVSRHKVLVTVGTRPGGFAAAKGLAAMLADALGGVELAGLVSLRAERMRTRVVRGGRRVVLTVRAVIDHEEDMA